MYVAGRAAGAWVCARGAGGRGRYHAGPFRGTACTWRVWSPPGGSAKRANYARDERAMRRLTHKFPKILIYIYTWTHSTQKRKIEQNKDKSDA